MKKAIIVTTIIIALAAVVVGMLYARGSFGISAENLEKDARKNQSIGSTWTVSKSVNERLGALIFYNDTLDEHTFSIYVTRGNLLSRYYFRSGGSDSGIESGIREFKFPPPYDINGSALISMNTDNVARIEIDNDIKITIIDIDSDKPFAVVIPNNPGSVTLYDIEENVVPINQ